MRWLSKSMMGLGVLAILSVGCGSTAGDRLILRFIRWDTTGLPTQADQVTPAAANVDVVPDLCVNQTATNILPTCEVLTPTTINAVFENDQASDIQLQGYTVYVPGAGVAPFTGQLGGTVVGGRCSNAMDRRQCSTDDDCTINNTPGTCTHTQTTIPGIVIFDCLSKAHVDPRVFGSIQSMTVVFFGSDANQDFQTSAGYTVQFGDFCTCMAGTACLPVSSLPGASCPICSMTQ
jgi:hypothetical protein